MAFISEIHYRTGDVVTSDSSTHEFVEITLAPGEDPADFVVSFYGRDGALMDDPGDNIEATGVVNAEVTLSDLVGVPHPQFANYTIYTITATSSVHELINATSSQVADEANYVALTNTATGTVEDAIGIGANKSITLTGGAADGASTTNAPKVGAGESVQFDFDGNNVSGPRTSDDSTVPCFCAGARIAVPGGARRVEDLVVGDEVITRDHGPQRIRWIGRRTLSAVQIGANPKLRPVRIGQGSLGPNQPSRDLFVSRQHRMLVSTEGTNALLSAIKLTQLPGINVDPSLHDVTYVHLLFDRHEVIFAEGAATESLYLGAQAINAVGAKARAEIQAIFPDLGAEAPRPAAHIPTNAQQKQLAADLAKTTGATA